MRSPRYFPLWLGQLVSNFDDTLHYIALVLVFQLTGQGVAVAALVAAEILPVLFLGPAAGVVIDRFSRKAVLIGWMMRQGRPSRPAALPPAKSAEIRCWSRPRRHGNTGPRRAKGDETPIDTRGSRRDNGRF